MEDVPATRAELDQLQSKDDKKNDHATSNDQCFAKKGHDHDGCEDVGRHASGTSGRRKKRWVLCCTVLVLLLAISAAAVAILAHYWFKGGYLKEPQLIHTLAQGGSGGITSLGDEVFTTRDHLSVVEVYDIATFAPKRAMPIKGVRRPWDLVGDEHSHSIYILEFPDDVVFRVRPDGNYTRWRVSTPGGANHAMSLSVAVNHTIIVGVNWLRELLEYTVDGEFVREIPLNGIGNPRGHVQLSSGDYLVTDLDNSSGQKQHRLCKLNNTGIVIKCYGGLAGSGPGQLHDPDYIVVDKEGFVLVVDGENHRILLFSSSLELVRELISKKDLPFKPWRMHLNEKRGLLFVSSINDGTADRVLVFRVKNV